ncbi:Ig-like domain-containing protein [Raineyella sp. W15-4]|uniref:L,D-transpeptidase n=1 Tax=Raineyella sp. W15-4 TaxID=3081651 RepID=UPI002953B056|nr:Ig-like domain-containing protein [Raineyella sp. W15-4]WOQ17899.1 Ig-like domain-containing protein [Raineyella sp. W15-4]
MTWKARGVAALTAVAVTVALGACAPASSTDRAGGKVAAGQASPAGFQAGSNVAADATDVPVDTLVKVTPTAGTLKAVTVTGAGTDKKGAPVSSTVQGSLADDGTWTATERLDPATVYTVVATGSTAAGESSVTSHFTTAALTLKQQVHVSITNQSGSTYGVAMPVDVTFDLPVTDKKSFEQNLKVTTVPAQNGSWGWVSDREVQWRPENYFQSGTKVSVQANLNGVGAGDGRYGQNSASVDFGIGQSRITKVDLASKQLTQYTDGQVVATVPVSGGKSGSETRSGTSVVMEKLTETRMASETVGIPNNSSDGYDMMVKYAMRITTSGEFLHAAPWNAAYFGRSNQSHGCVGMGTAEAQKLFGIIQVGDPVVVSGTGRPLDDGNGWTAWNNSWQQWQTKSALA